MKSNQDVTQSTRSRSCWRIFRLWNGVVGIAGLVFCGAWCGLPRMVASAEPSPESLELFEKQVRPILLNRCGKCHGMEKQEGELRVDSPAALMAGGASGNTVVPGSPERSLLLQAIEYRDESLQMPPPPESKLPEVEVRAIATWIRSGAAVPASSGAPAPLKKVDEEEIAKGREFWSFRPPQRSHLPPTGQPEWAQSGLDVFVLEGLEANQLRPTVTADRYAMIRRATFDLTGLPPTPDDVESFVSDSRPDAYSRLLDRLLAAPQHGERWGRHWLDVARYADSNGLDENVAFGNAWRYRDYVVSAFNRDLPYDTFLREQIAGDLLDDAPTTANAVPSDERREHLVATGFLALGPKVLAEVDEKKMEMDIVDEQVDSIGKALLGMTLGCARCHDHKFDPIPMSDYYALAGIFKSTRTMEHFKKVARWHENPIPTSEDLVRQAEFDKQVAERKAAVDQFVNDATEAVRAGLKPGEDLPKSIETKFPKETKDKLKQLRDELAAFQKTAPEGSSAMGAAEGTVENVPIHVRGSHLSLGKTVARGVPRVLEATAPIPNERSGRREFVEWLVRPTHPLTGRVMVNRLWRWHFGRGLVASADNFGRLGERPSHPQLLDWLSCRFVAEEAWSMKRMHRLFMLSSTYEQGSRADAKSVELDPDNRWWGRAQLRRLEAEAIRDALLAVSGLLDPSMGGSLLHVKNRGYLFDHTSLDKTNYDSRRRSIYLPVVRNNLYDVFSLFDYTDASVINGNRDTTTVAPQALFMLNSQLAIDASVSLASRVLSEGQTDEERVARIYLLAFGRPPSGDELALALANVNQLAGLVNGPSPDLGRQQAWTWFSQAILGANEFVYLR